jgi:threonylcarbamoyladenosine tRNA methylthiotransferase MtaB
MHRYSIQNFGCRATQADADEIARELQARGFARCGASEAADVVVLNTCTVTAAADTQARRAIREIHAVHRGVKIIVTGCYAQRSPEELAEIEGVACVVGNSHQMEIGRLALELLSEAPALARSGDFFPLAALHASARTATHPRARIVTGNISELTAVTLPRKEGCAEGRTRPTLKIQDGCANRCAYCILPSVRGRSRSLAPDEILTAVRAHVAAGVREVVLSGINLGAWGRDLHPRAEFLGLLRRILDETSLDSLRLSSIEPMDVTADLAAMAAASRRIAPHFHIPLQSGSDGVLQAMHRWYRTGHYAQRIAMLREMLPDAGIGADVMAGFPGETEKDHWETLAFLERLPFTYLHVFGFSARPGTEAARLGGQLPGNVIRRRARELRAVAAQKSRAFWDNQAGRIVRALTLGRQGDGWTEALSGNYLKLRVGGEWPANQWMRVRMPVISGELAEKAAQGTCRESDPAHPEPAPAAVI